MNSASLQASIDRASNREYHDDHLSDNERSALVDRYRAEHPDATLPMDLTDAFLEIIGW